MSVHLLAAADHVLGVVRPTPTELPLHQHVLRDLQRDHRVEIVEDGGQHLSQCIGLGNRAREAVQDEALGGVFLKQSVPHHADGDLVTDQLARVHIALGRQPERRLPAQVGPEEIPGRDVRHVEPLGQSDGLRPLARARRAHQNKSHDDTDLST